MPVPRLLLIGDVGGPSTYHVGDEAMRSANLAHLRERFRGSLHATVVSADPEWSEQEMSEQRKSTERYARSPREMLSARAEELPLGGEADPPS